MENISQGLLKTSAKIEMQVQELGQGKEYFEKYIKSASEANNITIQDQDEGEEQSIILTIKRGGMMENRICYENNQKVAEIPINLELGHKIIEKEKLLGIMKSLRKRSICLEKYLSSGGEADVFLGYIIDGEGNKIERVFRMVKAKQKEQIQEIQEEYQRVTAIKNPFNLISYEGLIELGDILIFVMKYYQCSLKQKMKSKLTNNEFWQIVFDLFDGLIELRIYNIIHSDIKPDNILLDNQGRCFYSDFGMALQLRKREQTTEERKGCTYKYCAPEYLQNQSLSYASDIFSIGLVVLELSELLEDKVVQKSVKEFVTHNLLQSDPKMRMNLEELIPSFIMKNISMIEMVSLKQFLIKVQHSFTSFLDKQDQLKNEFMNSKASFSYRIVQVMYVYIVSQNQSLISFKESINDISFQFLPIPTLAILFQKIALISRSAVSAEVEQKYTEYSLRILYFLPQEDDNLIFAKNCEIGLANLLYDNKKFEQAMEHYQAALKLCQDNDPTNKDQIQLLSSRIQISRNNLNEKQDLQLLLKSVEELRSCQDKTLLITQLHRVAMYYKEQKDKPTALKYNKEIVDVWNSICELKEYFFMKTQPTTLKLVSISLNKLGKFIESFEIDVQSLRLFNSTHEDLQKGEFTTKIMTNNLKKFTTEERECIFIKLISDKESDSVKAIILYEFFSFYYSIGNYESMFKALNAFNSIKEEIPLHKQVLLKSYLIQYYNKIDNKVESLKNLKEAFSLVMKANLSISTVILECQVFIFLQLMKSQMKDDAIVCFKSLEERQLMNQDTSEKKQNLQNIINLYKQALDQMKVQETGNDKSKNKQQK